MCGSPKPRGVLGEHAVGQPLASHVTLRLAVKVPQNEPQQWKMAQFLCQGFEMTKELTKAVHIAKFCHGESTPPQPFATKMVQLYKMVFFEVILVHLGGSKDSPQNA